MNLTVKYEFYHGKNRAILERFSGSLGGRCPFCNDWHEHGTDEGHRIPHCKGEPRERIAYGGDGTVLHSSDGYVVRNR